MDDARVLRLPKVLELTGLSRTTVWRMVKDQKFPAPVQLGARARGWRESEIQKWLRDLPGARPAPGT